MLDPLLSQLHTRLGILFLKRLTTVPDADSEKGFGLVCVIPCSFPALALSRFAPEVLRDLISMCALQINANAALFTSYDLLALQPTTEASFSLACLTHTQPSPLTAHIISLPLTLPRLPFRMKHTMVRSALRNGAVFELMYAGVLGVDANVGGGGGGDSVTRN